jgi:hypothetical protein
MKSAWIAPVVPARTTNIAVRIVVLLGIALASLVGWSTAFAQTPGSGAVANQPAAEFRLGFRALADRIPDVVGRPVEEEHYGANGDSLQQTTRGLMVWRKADNWTAFTDGSRSWVNGPNGPRDRANGERFPWEATPESPAPGAAPASSAAPSATPTEGSTPRTGSPWGREDSATR